MLNYENARPGLRVLLKNLPPRVVRVVLVWVAEVVVTLLRSTVAAEVNPGSSPGMRWSLQEASEMAARRHAVMIFAFIFMRSFSG